MTKIIRLFDLLTNYLENYPDRKTALAGKVSGQWKTWSVKEYSDTADRLSRGFYALGLRKSDTVATIINNSPEWNFFDMALMQIGAVQVPIYPTISEANYRYIFKEAEVKYIIVSNREIYNRIAGILPEIPSLIKVYTIEKTVDLNHWSDILEEGGQNAHFELEAIKSGISGSDLASIIYTSGTTGNPKGVMLSHSNFISNFMACSDILSKNPVSTALSFLPLCHVYERMLNYVYQYNGVSIYYAESIDKLRDNMKEVHPEFFCAVPRVIEKTYGKLVRTGRGLKGFKKQLFFWALNLAHRFEFEEKNGWFYEFQRIIADRLVYSKWRQAFGGKLQVIVTGGASLNPVFSRTFWCARIKIMEGYGLTETSPVVAVSDFEKGGVKFGTVGKKLPGVEIRIAEDGEILCKSPGLMMGYYKQPDLTKDVIDGEAWFHTGDIGKWIEGVYLKITDRKKEIFKTSGGKYIAPQVVENEFRESPFIDSVIIIGENRNYTTALIVPNFEHIESWCKVKNHPYTSPEEAIMDERIIKRIQKEVDLINSRLDKIEQVKRFRLLAENWSVEKGELSPTMKLRRKIILEKNKELIERMYH
ncbi:MAG: long-chain fatty acid--CoA ligase [Bacteroidetes bacterium]|nr:long-chain fatty acid--CoA ligase [Bacteroidota bacterium]